MLRSDLSNALTQKELTILLVSAQLATYGVLHLFTKEFFWVTEMCTLWKPRHRVWPWHVRGYTCIYGYGDSIACSYPFTWCIMRVPQLVMGVTLMFGLLLTALAQWLADGQIQML